VWEYRQFATLSKGGIDRMIRMRATVAVQWLDTVSQDTVSDLLVCCVVLCVMNSKKDLTTAFREYDQDNDGHISMDEARLFLSQQPFNFSQEKVANTLTPKINSCIHEYSMTIRPISFPFLPSPFHSFSCPFRSLPLLLKRSPGCL